MEFVYLSNSSINKHRTCPQSWVYGHLRKLEKVDPDDVPAERDFGSWWHALRAVDSLMRGRQLGSLQWAPEKVTTTDEGPEFDVDDKLVPGMVIAEARRWWAKQTPLYRETFEERIGEPLAERLLAVDALWHEENDEETRTERPLAVELKWERVLYVDQERQITYVVIGYVDEVYLDTKRNLVVARDHKTGKSMSGATSADDMMDSQLQFYAWGAAPIVAEWKVGRINATAYDRIRMKKPTTPVVTQSGALSKSVTDYDLTTYLEWCKTAPTYPGRKKDGSDGGVYQVEEAMVEKLSRPDWRSRFAQRTRTPLNPNIVKTHLLAGLDSAEAMGVTREKFNARGFAGRNLGKAACSWCDFAKICRAEMWGGAQGTYNLVDFGLREKPKVGR